MEKSTALQPAELNKIVAKARSEVGTERLPPISTMKLVNKGSKVEDLDGKKIPEQHFYLSYIDDSEGTKKINIAIGKHPEVVIIKRRYSYSMYSKTEDRLIAWTNEIDEFTQQQEVRLINNLGNQPYTEFAGNYFDFKEYKNQNYVSRDGRQEMKFRNILYVLFPNEFTEKKIFRLFIGNSSVTGVPDGEIQGDYKNPEPKSLLDFATQVRASEPNVFFGTKCRLGSKYHEGEIDYYITLFEPVGPVENFQEMAQLWFELSNQLEEREKIEFSRFPEEEPSGNEREATAEELPDL